MADESPAEAAAVLQDLWKALEARAKYVAAAQESFARSGSALEVAYSEALLGELHFLAMLAVRHGRDVLRTSAEAPTLR